MLQAGHENRLVMLMFVLVNDSYMYCVKNYFNVKFDSHQTNLREAQIIVSALFQFDG